MLPRQSGLLSPIFRRHTDPTAWVVPDAGQMKAASPGSRPIVSLAHTCVQELSCSIRVVPNCAKLKNEIGWNVAGTLTTLHRLAKYWVRTLHWKSLLWIGSTVRPASRPRLRIWVDLVAPDAS